MLGIHPLSPELLRAPPSCPDRSFARGRCQSTPCRRRGGRKREIDVLDDVRMAKRCGRPAKGDQPPLKGRKVTTDGGSASQLVRSGTEVGLRSSGAWKR